MEEYYLLTFESTHAAIATDSFLKKVGCVIMPVPRFISASCGMSIRFSPEKREAVETLFTEKSRLGTDEYAYYHIIIDKAQSDVSCERIQIGES